MAGYNAPPTWAAGPWTFSDANVYIRDNFNSVRNYQTGKRLYSDSASFGTSQVTVATHSALLTAAPTSEQSKLMVWVVPDVTSSTSGSPTLIVVEIFDQNSNSIGISTFIRAAGTDRWAGCCLGAADVSSGTNPGFSVKMFTDAGSVTGLGFKSSAIVGPLG